MSVRQKKKNEFNIHNAYQSDIIIIIIIIIITTANAFHVNNFSFTKSNG